MPVPLTDPAPASAVVFNPGMRRLAPSATLAINERSAALSRSGRRVYRLGFGQSPFPVPAPVVEALRRHAHVKDYLPVQGLPALREAVAAYHARTDGLDAAPENVLIGPGSKELMFLLQLVLDADLLLPRPSWVSYAPQAQMLGRRVRWLPTALDEGWRLQPDTLEAHCLRHPDRSGLLILNTPNNPAGTSYDADRLEVLAGIARRHGLLILSDEIYGALHHEGAHVSMARLYPEGTVVSAGLSKWCGAGGWRLGTFLFPAALRRLAEAMQAAASETYTTASAPIQHAAVCAYEGGPKIEAYLTHARRILRALGQHAAQQFEAAGLGVAPPDGGFYLFPDFGPLREALAARGITTSPNLAEHLLEETGVATLPGTAFGQPPESLTLRLAYVDFDGEQALATAEAASLEPAFLRARCGRVLEAIDLICAWTASF